MSTTIVFDQRPTFFLQSSSFMLTYTHILSGILIILLLWFGLTVAFIKPPVREVPYRPHSNLPKSSDSSTILVESKNVPKKCMTKTDITLNKGQKSQPTVGERLPSAAVTTNDSNHFIIINNPFSDVAASVKVSTSPSLALYPFVRRMSISRHRPSICIPPPSSNTAASLPQRAIVKRHGSLADDNSSYLPPPHVPSGKVRQVPDDDDKNQSVQMLPVSESKTLKRGPSTSDLPKKPTKFKRVRTRVRGLFQKALKS